MDINIKAALPVGKAAAKIVFFEDIPSSINCIREIWPAAEKYLEIKNNRLTLALRNETITMKYSSNNWWWRSLQLKRS